MAYNDGGQKRRGNRVIAYVRVSDTTGREDTLISNEVQLHQIQLQAKREGLEIVDVVEDLDMSGRSSKKRSIGPIIARIEAGEADGVAVWKISRWGRNLVESLLNISDLQRVGGFIVSSAENLNDIDTPMGRFSLSQMLLIAQLQSDQIGETWANIREYRVSLGKPATGGKRWGYHWVQAEDRYEVDQEVAPWVARCYQDFVDGRPLTALVTMLRDAGVTAPSGKEWTTGTLRQTLDAGFAAGLIVSYSRKADSKIRWGVQHSTFAVGQHEAIIGGDLWDTYIHTRLYSKRPARHVTPVHKLSGLVRCATCGASMSLTQAGRSVAGEPYRYFRCNRVSKTKHSAENRCPDPAQIRDKTLDAVVLEWVVEHATVEVDPRVEMKRELAARKADGDHKRLSKDLARLEARRKGLLDLLLDGTITKETYKAKDDEMGVALEDLRDRLREAGTAREVNQIPDLSAFSALVQGWHKMPAEALRTALQTMIHHVEVASKHDEARPRVHVVPVWEYEALPA